MLFVSDCHSAPVNLVRTLDGIAQFQCTECKRQSFQSNRARSHCCIADIENTVPPYSCSHCHGNCEIADPKAATPRQVLLSGFAEVLRAFKSGEKNTAECMQRLELLFDEQMTYILEDTLHQMANAALAYAQPLMHQMNGDERVAYMGFTLAIDQIEQLIQAEQSRIDNGLSQG